MDRFFLRALVREVTPRLLGRRARNVKRWGDSGLVIFVGARRGSDIVVSLSPRSPGFYVGRPPVEPDEAPSPTRFRKLLSGAELVGMEAARLDRVVTWIWQQSKPSGSTRTMELVVEWPGTRTAAFLIDSVTREVLEVVSPGTPRTVAGEVYQALAPPPGSREVAADRRELVHRLAEARREGHNEQRALREASGLSPLLVEEVRALASAGPLSVEDAFERVATGLDQEARPVVLSPVKDSFHRESYRLALSLFPPTSQERWLAREFSNCNDAAAAFIAESHRLRAAREMYTAAAGELRKRLKKTRKLNERLSGELGSLQNPGELRRWGEILLAGLRQAKRIDEKEAILVPDPYQMDSPLVRVPIDPRLDLAENAKRYFARARKMIRSRERLEVRLAQTRDELEHLETIELAVEDAVEPETLGALLDELHETGALEKRRPSRRASSGRATKKGAARSLEPRRFRLTSGAEALAGRSARSNEELTFRIARPDDLWFHAAATAGAHVVLRLRSGAEAVGGDIEESAAVAGFFSKARGSTAAEILYTPRKNVRKIPGAPPGTVRLTRFQTVRVRPALPAAPHGATKNEGYATSIGEQEE